MRKLSSDTKTFIEKYNLAQKIVLATIINHPWLLSHEKISNRFAEIHFNGEREKIKTHIFEWKEDKGRLLDYLRSKGIVGSKKTFAFAPWAKPTIEPDDEELIISRLGDILTWIEHMHFKRPIELGIDNQIDYNNYIDDQEFEKCNKLPKNLRIDYELRKKLLNIPDEDLTTEQVYQLSRIMKDTKKYWKQWYEALYPSG